MKTIITLPPNKPDDIAVTQMEEGQYAIVTKQVSHPETIGCVVRRVYQSVIGITPESGVRSIWNIDFNRPSVGLATNFRVKLLPKGTEIEIFVD